MAERTVSGQASGVPPYLLAMLVCDQVIVDEATKKKTLVGVFDTIQAHNFPFQQGLAVYAKITDAEGRYVFKVEHVHALTNRVTGHLVIPPVDIADRLKAVEFAAHLTVKVEAAGLYEFRLYANNAYLGRATYLVAARDLEGQ